jgi:hypothetical protein
MRHAFIGIVPLVSAALVGCGYSDKHAEDPGDFVRAEMFSHAEPQSVRCGCDADGGLHITTPPGARVLQPADQTFESEAIIELPQPQRGQPIRVTKSLGFIGDNKLTETVRSTDASYGYSPYGRYYGRPTTFYHGPPPTFYGRGYYYR